MIEQAEALFDSTLGSLADRGYKSGHPNPIPDRDAGAHVAIAMFKLAEALILSPSVIIKIHGENVVAPLLVKSFGVSGLRELLDEGAIRFVLWNEDVVFTQEEIQGVDPIASLRLSNPEHSDPETSALAGIEKWGSFVSVGERSSLTKAIQNGTAVLPENLSGHATSRVMAAYREGSLAAELNADSGGRVSAQEERRRLCRLANELMECAIVARYRGAMLEAGNPLDAFEACYRRLSVEQRLYQSTREIFTVERMPAIDRLILERVLSFSDVLKIRKRAETRAFRKWLWTQNRDPNLDVATEYLQSIARGQSRAPYFKAARVASIALLGASIGTAVAGPIGTAIGAGLGIADAYLLEPVMSGANPRAFFSDVLEPIYREALLTRGQTPPSG